MHLDSLYASTDRFGNAVANVTDDEDEYEDEEDNALSCCNAAAGRAERSNDNAIKGVYMMKNGSSIWCSYALVGRLFLFALIATVLYIFYNAISSPSRLPDAIPGRTASTNFNATTAQSILDNLCHAYERREQTGDICDWLCVKKNYTIMDLYEGGSKKVLKLNENGKDLILKMDHSFAHEYEYPDPRVDDEEFTDKVLEIVNEQLHLDWPSKYKPHLLRKLWPLYSRQGNRSLTQVERRSLWALLMQEEFINFRILHLSRITPKLLGTCGHAYQVEYLIPFKMKAYYMNLKAKILVHLMGTLKLFYEFLNDPLQWCDVKFENLGLSAEYPKRFVVMDSDMLYTESKLNSLLTSRSCTKDDDCNFFDCHSMCNNSTGFCTGRTNDNVDVFCEKLVNRLFGSFWSKSNKYLSACHESPMNASKRLSELRLVWSWSLSDI